ncbi:type II toxin-antitoxin system YoeB family toxin [Coxiella burnetii]|nr:type II toxin-antitoxin system YoeB family toxin [Coxiella burnetii]MCF2094551.1 type II toxin-antitoxin system YoeB family toxin [Coxiella burnetii]MCF2096552.1 type II toxin-antitoxin system YoeB family toxin [Coxiella burnetii]MCF2098616.1 type II toxin-antitoxin system YoeB family toxin [Coxiella burnetii]MCF2100596.1 type II toxin-antitoxin system YoeB family toxin [Coxiella burnetii]MCF2102686.1 type II toxin-antitoxin system YoeB family toxin [Coxiella burnetii]
MPIGVADVTRRVNVLIKDAMREPFSGKGKPSFEI